jgi:ketosteroid isomerase-like protein
MAEGDAGLHELTYRATFGGQPVEFRECSVSRLNADGSLAEVRVYFDRLTLLRQLGFGPEV